MGELARYFNAVLRIGADDGKYPGRTIQERAVAPFRIYR